MPQLRQLEHLHILSDAGLVHERKVGRETRYTLEVAPLRELKDWLAFYEQFWSESFDRLAHFLETDIESE